jgi:hypothetical protein
MFEKICIWARQSPNYALVLITLVALGPFLAKPFNIDDPLFIWAGHQIQAHPLNPYGFNVAWDTTAAPMWQITDNPPLTCYYIALTAGIFGWSEIALHVAFLIPAIAVVLGTCRLAQRLCQNPMAAAMITLLGPFFLVSATSVMCDVTLLAFWIWAAVFWVEGPESPKKLAAAGLLIALAEMTKYFGVCLIPLLAAYSLARRQPIRRWGPALLIPLGVLCAYQYVTQSVYGYSLLYRAMDFASLSQNVIGFSKIQNSLIALSFAGGGMATAVFFAPLFWQKRELPTLTAAALLVAGILYFDASLWNRYGSLHGWALGAVKIQMIFWAAGGLWLLALAVSDLCRHRDADSLLLFLWVAGTFFFTAFCNWTVNARSILPMAPAVAILVARRLQSKFAEQTTGRSTGMAISLVAGGTLTLLVTRADFSAACAVRQSALETCARFGGTSDCLWFQGHWGFQFYMDPAVSAALDFEHSILKPGDLLAVPAGNTSVMAPESSRATPLDVLTFSGLEPLATWNVNAGAGFYAAVYGPVPFVFGAIPPERVSIYAWKASPETFLKPSRQ